MRISKNSWHYKLYVFMSQWNAAWRAEDDYHLFPKDNERIGLCPYMRMILIWGPLAILSNIFPLGTFAAVVFLFPMSANGLWGVFWLFFWIATVIVALFGIGFLKDFSDKRAERKKSQLDSNEEPKSEPETGFFKILIEYVKAFKTKICPVLEVKQDG